MDNIYMPNPINAKINIFPEKYLYLAETQMKFIKVIEGCQVYILYRIVLLFHILFINQQENKVLNFLLYSSCSSI